MAQFARPSSTVAAGGWSYNVDSLHEDTDEETPDGDTSYAEASSDDTTMRLGLSSVTDPASSTGHVLRFTAEALNYGGGPEKLDVDLYDTGGLICHAFVNESINRGSYTEHEYTLSGDEADSISDYSTLEVYFIVDSLSGSEVIRVTQIEFEVPAGSQTFYQTCEGGITPSGGPVRSTSATTPAGGITPSGVLVRLVLKLAGLSGEITPDGVVIRRTSKAPAGEITPTGALDKVLLFLQEVAGGITPTGVGTPRANKNVAGGITPTGALVRGSGKIVAGGITPTGMATPRANKSAAGGITPTGALDKILLFLQNAAGELTPTGAATPRANKSAAGGITPTGVLVRGIGKIVAGGITPTGTLQRGISAHVAGGVTPSGVLGTAYSTVELCAGSLEPAGSLGTLYIEGGGESDVCAIYSWTWGVWA